MLALTSPGLAQPRPGVRTGMVRHEPDRGVLEVWLDAGEALLAGTCGVQGAWFRGNTTLRLRRPDGERAAFNADDCGGTGSLLYFIAHEPGAYVLETACQGYEPCGGLVAWQAGPPESLSVTGPPLVRRSTAGPPPPGLVSHVPRTTVVRVELHEGDQLVAAHCGIDGAHHQGDPTVRIVDANGETLAFDDDGCGGLGSRAIATAPRDGVYSVVAGCYGASRCSGMLGYLVREGPPRPPELRVVTRVRGLVGVDNPGGALVGEALLEARFARMLGVRLGGMPLGLGGGELGGVAAGTLSLVVVADAGSFAVGIGGGISVMASRFAGLAQQEAAVLVPYARVGGLHDFHVDGQMAVAFFDDRVALMSLMVMARLPFRDFELAARLAAGGDGVVLGELEVLFWVLSERNRPILGVSVHAGAGGVFYEPICRFGSTCTSSHWYSGPLVGAGLEWRP